MGTGRSTWKLALSFLLIFLASPGWSRQPQTAQSPAASVGQTSGAAAQDPQGLSVLNQTLGVAGGAGFVAAVQDYAAIGTVTCPLSAGSQGSVKLLGMHGTEFRIDAVCATGTRSQAVADGVTYTKSESGVTQSTSVKAPVPSSDAFPFQTPLFPGSMGFPVWQLTAIVGNPRYAISYKGVVEIDGHSTHQVEFQRGASQSPISPGIPPRAREIFIDTTTYQIVRVSDSLPKNVQHDLHYSDYRSVSGILMPFSITEEIGGQQIWTIQLNQITFNTGLTPVSFEIQ